MIADIELTLVSIIQGVALAVLITNANTVVARLQFAAWPYVVAALFVILVFWSRAVLHIITVIRWPIEFGHNFLYIACALVEAISFSQISHPARWFGFGAAFIAVGWLLFAYDLRLVNARISDSAGAASDRMCELVKRDQYLNLLVLLPTLFCFNVASAWSIHTLPKLFLGHHAHLWLITVQLIAVFGYLLYVLKFFGKLAPFIADARAEWRDLNKDL
jgi:hypothetical protein